MSRPKQFDGSPISVRLTAAQQDSLCQEALRRDVDLAQIIREKLFVSQNAAQAQTSAY